MTISRQTFQSHSSWRRLVALCVALALLAAMPMAPKTAEAAVSIVEGVPADGRYTMRNVGVPAYLQGQGDHNEGDGEVFTSYRLDIRNAVDLTNLGDDVFYISFAHNDTYLDGAGSQVELSSEPHDGARWQLIPLGNNTFYVKHVTSGRFLSRDGNEVRSTRMQTATEQWVFTAGLTNGYVGSSIALQSQTTNRWLDTDRGGRVNQSRHQRADDVWHVLDAGDTYVYLQNAVTGRFLDSDKRDGDAETSKLAHSDDRWELYFHYDPPDEAFLIRSIDHGGFITALSRTEGFNTVTADFGAAAFWDLEIISAP